VDRATSFGADVGAYEQGRPEYVDEHVAWLLDGVRGRVLDLGAGSGKLTRAVVRLGFEAVAVDPDGAMLARNAAAPCLIGRADAIPLPDASVAAVVVGQAWHWFDPATAGPEIVRVLVPGGRLGLIWNTRDSSHPFVATLAEIAGASPAEQMVADEAVRQAPGFGPFERRQWSRTRVMTAAEVEAMITSRSAFLTAPVARQEEVLAALRELVATHPHTAGREHFDYPLHTTGYRAEVQS
jgi:SAM-dependent methyltransferase